MYKTHRDRKYFDRISDICFICNTCVLILLMIFGVLIMHILGLELSVSILINVLMFFMYAFLEERCISKYINGSVKWLYNRIKVSDTFNLDFRKARNSGILMT